MSGVEAAEVRHRPRSRWLVHVGLIRSFNGAVVAFQLSRSITIDVAVGLVFMAYVETHLVQRRHATSKSISNLDHLRAQVQRRRRLASADLLLAFLALNVLASGVVDSFVGRSIPLSLAATYRDQH
jgi:hypothetical protein